MKTNIWSGAFIALAALSLSACSQDENTPDNPAADGKMNMNFTFSMPGATKATETAFEEGDKVGLFVNLADKPLEIGGNTVNNVMLTKAGSNWNPQYKIYWDEGTYNAQAYYPYQKSISSIEDLPFEVKLDQSTAASGDELSGYEASDFLFASATGIKASEKAVDMKFRHIMSKLTLNLVKGEDYEGDLPDYAEVRIFNTVTTATIDLEAGVATKDMMGSQKTIKACQSGATSYSAIIVPQRIDSKLPLFEIIIDGISFLYESKFVFKPGVHHTVNLILDKNADQLKIEIGGEISGWN